MSENPVESHHLPAVLAQFPEVYRDLQADFQAGEGGFSGAIVVRLRGPDRHFCLRGWPVDGVPPRRILGLHRLLAHIRQQGVTQVAVPIAGLQGSTLIAESGRRWQLEPWMPGAADYRDNPSENRLRAAMRCLARWHAAAAQFEPRPEEAAWFFRESAAPSPAVLERCDLIREWAAGRLQRLRQVMASAAGSPFRDVGEEIVKLFERKAGGIARELAAARTLRFHLQPCLRDVWHDHLLFTGEELTGLIDPSACRSENRATDLARLLGSLPGDDLEAWNAALAEYQRLQPLSLDETALVHLLDRSSVLLSGLTWLGRVYLRSERFPRPESIVARMAAIRDRLERLGERRV